MKSIWNNLLEKIKFNNTTQERVLCLWNKFFLELKHVGSIEIRILRDNQKVYTLPILGHMYINILQQCDEKALVMVSSVSTFPCIVSNFLSFYIALDFL